jgi:iron-sulfur cluster assembly protein
MTNQPSASAASAVITLTPSAVAEVKRLMSLEKGENLFLRLSVAAGGCSGMSYTMAFDNQRSEFDRVFDFDGLEVRVDFKALMYLVGSNVDYKGGLRGGFEFHNPNAKRSCGCGSSFTA